ncbi:MAG: succinate dehydrogenase assembly factor 2 [Burkholderiales bacterium]
MDSAADLNRMRWQCRRGMLELDLTLAQFLETEYPQLPENLRKALRELLELSDPDLWDAICGVAEPPDQDIRSVLAMLRHIKSNAV